MTNATTPARLFFTGGNQDERVYRGMLNFTAQQIATATVTVFIDVSELFLGEGEV